MANPEYPFRTSLRGYHMDDVAEYIKITTAQHQNELRELQQIISDLRKENHSLQQQLDLMIMFTPTQKSPSVSETPAKLMSKELEAYRRAQTVERNANDRARELYRQMDAVCAETMEEFRATDAAVNQTLQVISAQMDALAESYRALSAFTESSRQKLASINGLHISPEENTGRK